MTEPILDEQSFETIAAVVRGEGAAFVLSPKPLVPLMRMYHEVVHGMTSLLLARATGADSQLVSLPETMQDFAAFFIATAGRQLAEATVTRQDPVCLRIALDPRRAAQLAHTMRAVWDMGLALDAPEPDAEPGRFVPSEQTVELFAALFDELSEVAAVAAAADEADAAAADAE